MTAAASASAAERRQRRKNGGEQGTTMTASMSDELVAASGVGNDNGGKAEDFARDVSLTAEDKKEDDDLIMMSSAAVSAAEREAREMLGGRRSGGGGGGSAAAAAATRDDSDDAADSARRAASGTLLEAAFVDPAYPWPPPEGEGRNAIELQATLQLMKDDEEEKKNGGGGGDDGPSVDDEVDVDDSNSIVTTESTKKRMEMPPEPEQARQKLRSDGNNTTATTTSVRIKKKAPFWKFWKCCKSDEAVEVQVAPDADEDDEKGQDAAAAAIAEYEEKKSAALAARRDHAAAKKRRQSEKELAYRKKQKYNRVPEGILIYRLDTSNHTLRLMSKPHGRTDTDSLVRSMEIVAAVPSPDKSRRGMILTGSDGREATLVACEQRTATAWLEAMNLMFAKNEKLEEGFFGGAKRHSSRWSHEKLNDADLHQIEGQYLSLADYSNKLIRAGALPGGRKGSGGAGGIYYSVQKVSNDPWDDPEEEALEAIAKRRAVIKDSWDFYRMICSLLRDRNKYDEAFRRMMLDPVYPYLNSMTGLNDPGETGASAYENADKPVLQKDLPEYATMSKVDVARAIVERAEQAMPSLVEICKALAGSLGMEEVGVGPIKEVSAALRKAEKKYDGDLLKVTDYCRALLVVKDFPALLALLELARDSFGPLIRRVKMCTLKADHAAKPGGYRDCIINVELKGHVCEIQVHLWPMWVVCGVDGFRHYRHCVEYSTDDFDDPYQALDGLDRKTVAELIVMAEEAVVETPLDNLEWYHEKFILDYFAEAGLFMKHGLDVWAEIILRHLVRLRTESPDIGPDHHETTNLRKYLAQALAAQGKTAESKSELDRIKSSVDHKLAEETKDAHKGLWEGLEEAYELLIDPNKKVREQEERHRQRVKASKRQWRRIRQERFQFLDVDLSSHTESHSHNRR